MAGATKKSIGSKTSGTKKRPRLGDAPLDSGERRRAHELVVSVAQVLRLLIEDIDDATLGPGEREDLRENLRYLEDFMTRSSGGPRYERNRRWSLLYELTKAARDSGEKPSAADVCAWPALPRRYAAENKDATKARELLARSVTAKQRRMWLELLVDAVAEVEADEMGDHKWEPESFESTVLRHQRDEHRVLGVSDTSLQGADSPSDSD